MRLTRCKSCDAPIFWAITPAGKPVPINDIPNRRPDGYRGALYRLSGERDAKGTPKLVVSEDEVGFLSHFATCPNASSHSKKPRAQGGLFDG